MPVPADFERGGIVGRAYLADSLAPPPSNSYVKDSPWYRGEHAFVLGAARPLPFFPCKGKLNFFEMDYLLPDTALTTG
ncbi:hypothetical protein [Paraburkholderia sp. UCT31]|uniref:hypothetical protein n=1 Tax=Paraburkholderia sp. UCT31 TaxID=2615209 RepID=UPI00223C21BD|nr:hypothetical protein [Paraburkholderia sp. UCT31]